MLTRVKKNTWKGVFLLTALITSFLGGKFLDSYYTYYSLSERASARVLEWEIEEITKSKYAIAAVYEFEAQDKVMMGRTLFTRPYFPNYYSAEINLEEWQSYGWDVWYQVKHPKKSTWFIILAVMKN